MNKEDKELQKQLVDEMMKVSKTNPDVMIYMQVLMECYEDLEKKLDQYKNNWEELKTYLNMVIGMNFRMNNDKLSEQKVDDYTNILNKMKKLEGE